jgi:hypothetical protein
MVQQLRSIIGNCMRKCYCISLITCPIHTLTLSIFKIYLDMKILFLLFCCLLSISISQFSPKLTEHRNAIQWIHFHHCALLSFTYKAHFLLFIYLFIKIGCCREFLKKIFFVGVVHEWCSFFKERGCLILSDIQSKMSCIVSEKILAAFLCKK